MGSKFPWKNGRPGRPEGCTYLRDREISRHTIEAPTKYIKRVRKKQQTRTLAKLSERGKKVKGSIGLVAS